MLKLMAKALEPWKLEFSRDMTYELAALYFLIKKER